MPSNLNKFKFLKWFLFFFFLIANEPKAMCGVTHEKTQRFVFYYWQLCFICVLSFFYFCKKKFTSMIMILILIIIKLCILSNPFLNLVQKKIKTIVNRLHSKKARVHGWERKKIKKKCAGDRDRKEKWAGEQRERESKREKERYIH